MDLAATFSEVGQSSPLINVRPGESVSYTLVVAGAEAFIGTVKLQKTKDLQAYETIETFTGTSGTPLEGTTSGTHTVTELEGYKLRFICEDFDDVTPSDNIVATITSADNDVLGYAQLKDGLVETKDGRVLMRVRENGIDMVAGDLTTDTGVGAKAGSTVAVQEFGDGVVHKTVLTLTNTPIEIVSVTTGNGVGGTKVYDFPAGRLAFLGCMATLSVAVATAEQDNFTDNAPEGDLGIGSVAPANADALGTDATDDDYGTATAFTMATFADTSVLIPSEAMQQFNNVTSVGARDVYVNALVDASDIDDGVTTEILVSGTITLHWINLGDE